MNYKLGIIGAGNMANAIVKGIIKSKIYDKSEIIISDINEIQRKKIEDDFGIKTTDNNEELAQKSDVILFAVKPQYFLSSIENINNGRSFNRKNSKISNDRCANFKDNAQHSCTCKRGYERNMFC